MSAGKPQRVWDDEGNIYEPWTDGWAVGFKVIDPWGEVQYVYLNPSGGSDTPGSLPCVFLYIGKHGDPSYDGAEHFYDLFDREGRVP
jgi:hypothetical protein